MDAITNQIVKERETITLATDIVKTIKDREKDIAQGPSAELATHFAIILGAVTQVAQGKIKAIHPSVNQSLLEVPQLLSKADLSWSSFTCYPDVMDMRARIQRLQKIVPTLQIIAEKLIDYSPQQEQSTRRSAAKC